MGRKKARPPQNVNSVMQFVRTTFRRRRTLLITSFEVYSEPITTSILQGSVRSLGKTTPCSILPTLSYVKDYKIINYYEFDYGSE